MRYSMGWCDPCHQLAAIYGNLPRYTVVLLVIMFNFQGIVALLVVMLNVQDI